MYRNRRDLASSGDERPRRARYNCDDDRSTLPTELREPGSSHDWWQRRDDSDNYDASSAQKRYFDRRRGDWDNRDSMLDVPNVNLMDRRYDSWHVNGEYDDVPARPEQPIPKSSSRKFADG